MVTYRDLFDPGDLISFVKFYVFGESVVFWTKTQLLLS